MQVTCDNPLCAKPFHYKGGQAHFERQKYHYCSRKCQNTTHGQAGTKRHRLWESARHRARRYGIEFELRVEDIPEIPTACPVLGIPLRSNNKAGPIDSSPSLDRIDQDLGYIPGNVRVISFRANRLRSNASAAELRLVADDAAFLEKARAR